MLWSIFPCPPSELPAQSHPFIHRVKKITQMWELNTSWILVRQNEVYSEKWITSLQSFTVFCKLFLLILWIDLYVFIKVILVCSLYHNYIKFSCQHRPVKEKHDKSLNSELSNLPSQNNSKGYWPLGDRHFCTEHPSLGTLK